VRQSALRNVPWRPHRAHILPASISVHSCASRAAAICSSDPGQRMRSSRPHAKAPLHGAAGRRHGGRLRRAVRGDARAAGAGALRLRGYWPGGRGRRRASRVRHPRGRRVWQRAPRQRRLCCQRRVPGRWRRRAGRRARGGPRARRLPGARWGPRAHPATPSGGDTHRCRLPRAWRALSRAPARRGGPPCMKRAKHPPTSTRLACRPQRAWTRRGQQPQARRAHMHATPAVAPLHASALARWARTRGGAPRRRPAPGARPLAPGAELTSVRPTRACRRRTP